MTDLLFINLYNLHIVFVKDHFFEFEIGQEKLAKDQSRMPLRNYTKKGEFLNSKPLGRIYFFIDEYRRYFGLYS